MVVDHLQFPIFLLLCEHFLCFERCDEMAPGRQKVATTVLSTQVLSHDGRTVLVEAGSFAPMQWFLQHGLGPSAEESGEPPKKRRRVGVDHQAKPDNVQGRDPDDILLYRTTIDLHFPDTLSGGPLTPELLEQHVRFDYDEALPVVASVEKSMEGATSLRIVLPTKKGAILAMETTELPSAVIDKLGGPQRRQSRYSPMPAERPATRLDCTLTRSRGSRDTVVRLDVSTHWKCGVSAFPQGLPTRRVQVYPDYDALTAVLPNGARDAIDHSLPWTPQDFYESVHVPSSDADTQGDFNDVLQSELYPFQRRAVHWMLTREGFRYDAGHIQRLPAADIGEDFQHVVEAEDALGQVCYINHLQGTIQRDPPDKIRVHGGILAEEMGLGKTVELMALISANSRSSDMPHEVYDDYTGVKLRPSKATLIITPASILSQWQAEFLRHAPKLNVLIYDGVTSKQMRNQDLKEAVSDMCTKYDVVLATYQTLRKEVHFAEEPPKRDMRAAPKVERKRSPLVMIQWWRLCLDEAQMVESGVSAAARVACRLPRVNSWAVSGTPLKKDVQDLHGLLVFLRFEPLSADAKLWTHLITNHRHLFRRIFRNIALRHTKAQIRDELRLPPQKRIVLTVPFTAIEQQHYTTLFSDMCQAVRVNSDGSPQYEDWDPEDSVIVEAMRNFLSRLRQTCLHPQVGVRNRRALGRGSGPLRTVDEVLEVMIEQKQSLIRVGERTLLGAQLSRAHILGNAGDDQHRAENALEIYIGAMQTSERFVKDGRQRLAKAKDSQGEKDFVDNDTADEDSSSESTQVIGRLRSGLRTSLQLQHSCVFYAATACFQIKSNEQLVEPNSVRFQDLEKQEVELYENAKIIRRELLKDKSRKAEGLMKRIGTLVTKDNFTKMPQVKRLKDFGGIESRRIVETSDALFTVVTEQGKIIDTWRAKMAEYLLKPLVDKDDAEIEMTGDEYEDSTKLQDELYAYFDAIKAVQADLNTFITSEDAVLIDYEVKQRIRDVKTWLDPEVPEERKPTPPHAPELTLELCAIRNKFRARKQDGFSIRALIHEVRSIETSLQMYESGPRAAERNMMHNHLVSLQSVFSSFSKALLGLEKEIDLFRETQNQRLEFYRQLQELSDDVQPHKEVLDETLDLVGLQIATQKEEEQSVALAKLKTQERYLLSLRDESGAQDGSRICVICRDAFENGVLTVCGHQYCKECIQHWWSEHKTCPVCKRRLTTNDFHNITYKPRELRAQEEVPTGPSSPHETSPSTSRHSSIYSDVDSQLMQEIKSIDLPASYGTKIDTLGRHLHWIREHDPGAKSIVFSQYREFLDVLGTALNDFKIGYNRLGRAGAAEKFKNDPSIDCLLLDAKTDSSGLTLVNATHVFICEPLIQTAVELQAIARVHRIGQTRPTTVWMYLINDTVEEAIYEISVARRIAHVQARQSSRAQQQQQKSRSATPALLQETAIDAANSDELQSAPLSKLLSAGRGGGELVGNDDLWQCLFGKAQGQQQTTKTLQPRVEKEAEVGRFLRAEAAEERARDVGAAR